MPVHCNSAKAKPNIDIKARDSSGLGKTRPHISKRYGASPDSGTFLALGPFT